MFAQEGLTESDFDKVKVKKIKEKKDECGFKRFGNNADFEPGSLRRG